MQNVYSLLLMLCTLNKVVLTQSFFSALTGEVFEWREKKGILRLVDPRPLTSFVLKNVDHSSSLA